MTLKASRTQVWLESLGDWSWPGQGGAAAEFLPPPWVPALPPRRERAFAGTGARTLPAARPCAGAPADHRRSARRARGRVHRARAGQAADARGTRGLRRRRRRGRAGSARGQLDLTRAVAADARAREPGRGRQLDRCGATTPPPPCTAKARSSSTCLRATPAPRSTTRCCTCSPAMTRQTMHSCRIGVQERLDRLIAAHAIPPMIAVMVQGGPGANNCGATRARSATKTTSWKCRS